MRSRCTNDSQPFLISRAHDRHHTLALEVEDKLAHKDGTKKGILRGCLKLLIKRRAKPDESPSNPYETQLNCIRSHIIPYERPNKPHNDPPPETVVLWLYLRNYKKPEETQSAK